LETRAKHKQTVMREQWKRTRVSEQNCVEKFPNTSEFAATDRDRRANQLLCVMTNSLKLSFQF
jgi:hypothetical protein